MGGVIQGVPFKGWGLIQGLTVDFALQNLSHVHSGDPRVGYFMITFISCCNCHHRQPHVSAEDTSTEVKSCGALISAGVGQVITG